MTAAKISRGTPQAIQWFIQRLQKIPKIDRRAILNSPELMEQYRPVPGKMFMYFYDPLHKSTLPYYDKFPLVLMVGPAKGGFYGLNLHYLQPRARAVFLSKLMSFSTSRNLDFNTRISMSYRLLSSTAKLAEFSTCFKHYLTSHVTSAMMVVPANEWDIAISLPTADFVRNY